jgi:hypothetical protein
MTNEQNSFLELTPQEEVVYHKPKTYNTLEEIQQNKPDGATKFSTMFKDQGIPIYYLNDKGEVYHPENLTWVKLHLQDFFTLNNGEGELSNIQDLETGEFLPKKSYEEIMKEFM